MNTPQPLKPPLYHRQRLLLYLLESADGLSKTEVQKLLLLYHKENRATYYDFVPYRYGGYSFQCTDDLELLKKRGWIREHRCKMSLNQAIDNAPWAANNPDRLTLQHWIKRYPQRGDNLIAQTYKSYPYYAQHSEIKERLLKGRVLTKDDLKTIPSALVPADKGLVVFTIGYEGICLETYLNKLIRHRVAVLCDVRSNPFSRKYGFSAPMLTRTVPKLNIKYEPFPELGIDSAKRRSLNTTADYHALFAQYRVDLPNRQAELQRLQSIIQAGKPIALTCFEANHQCCHRHYLSQWLQQHGNYQVEHL